MKTSLKARAGFYLHVPFTYFLLISFTRAPSGLQLLVFVNFNTCTAFCDSFSHRDMRLVCATLLYVLKTIGWVPTLYLGRIIFTNQWLYFLK